MRSHVISVWMSTQVATPFVYGRSCESKESVTASTSRIPS